MKLHYLSPEEEQAIKANIPWESIDQHIEDLVLFANQVTGLATVQSCAGHAHPTSDGETIQVDAANLCFRCTEQIAHDVLFSVAFSAGIRDVSVRYFDDGTFWISLEVEPSERGRLFECMRLLVTP